LNMGDKITLDRETFKALAADTRVDILKKIAQRKLTLTDLSGDMGMSPSTIKEHLDRLVEVGLIEADERGMKWKYYTLTEKGRNIVSPNETRVWILLGTSLLVMFGALLSTAWQLAGAGVMESQTPGSAEAVMLAEPPRTDLMFAAKRDAVADEAAPSMLKSSNDAGPDAAGDLRFEEAQAKGTDDANMSAEAVELKVADAPEAGVGEAASGGYVGGNGPGTQETVGSPAVEALVFLASAVVALTCIVRIFKRRAVSL